MDATARTSPLSRMEQKRRALEHKIKRLQRKELVALPARIGLDSIDNLILALLEYGSPALRARFSAADNVSISILSTVNARARPRAKFPSEIRELIRKELEAGMKSVAEISREYGPSHPTIMGWKREWGLTRPRNRRAGADGNERE